MSSICLAEIPHKTLHPGILCYLSVLTEASYPSQLFGDHASTFDIAYISFQDNYLPIRQQRYIVQPRVNAIIISLSNTHYHLSMLLCYKGCQQTRSPSPWFDVNVGSFLLTIKIPVESKTKTNSSPHCISWIILINKI